MSWFEKEETVDLTELQKRGILKKALEKENVNEGKDIDFTSASSVSNSSNPFDLLSSLASSSGNTTRTLANNEVSNDDIQHLKVKLEDLEYKLDRFLERIEKIESKILESGKI